MKKIIIEIIVEELKNPLNSIVDNIINEAEEEKRQWDFTKRMNAKTSEAHREVAKELAKELNETLKPLGVEFSINKLAEKSNGYHPTEISTILQGTMGDYYVSLIVEGVSSTFNRNPLEEFPKTKYITYYGAYELKYQGHKVESVEEFLKSISSGLKEHYKRTN